MTTDTKLDLDGIEAECNQYRNRFVCALPPAQVLAMVTRIRDLERAFYSMASTIENMDKAVRETLGIDPDADDALPELVADWMEGCAQAPARAGSGGGSMSAAAPATQHTETK
ncbi:hypothetical protein CNECB9_2370161 [Cupriavidus necator]|uniref:Uncharacterized protein n=1 Tax=Cupriavidus necator TaxID=106590 RepID=A0A1K0J928_CUPNE|nr:hypothetical protein CNECB9_2370161 [Cupriavidus necator]